MGCPLSVALKSSPLLKYNWQLTELTDKMHISTRTPLSAPLMSRSSCAVTRLWVPLLHLSFSLWPWMLAVLKKHTHMTSKHSNVWCSLLLCCHMLDPAMMTYILKSLGSWVFLQPAPWWHHSMPKITQCMHSVPEVSLGGTSFFLDKKINKCGGHKEHVFWGKGDSVTDCITGGIFVFCLTKKAWSCTKTDHI